MKSNQFVVDLGSLNLNSVQRKNINSAIQGAVTRELAQFKLNKKVVLIPVDNNWPPDPKDPDGHILIGLIIRPVDKSLGQALEKFI